MKRTVLSLLVLSLVVVACSSADNESGKSLGNVSVKAAILDNSQTFVLHEKYRGDEKSAVLSEIYYSSGDIPAKKSKVKLLRQAADKIDRVTIKHVQAITDLKKNLLKNAGCNDCLTVKKGGIEISEVDITKLNSSSSVQLEIEDLSKNLFDYAKEISSIVAGSQITANSEGDAKYNEKYSFELKEITKNEPLAIQLDKQLKANPVNVKDVYSIKDIVINLLQIDFPEEWIDLIDAIHYLTIIERRILTSRVQALSSVRYRISG